MPDLSPQVERELAELEAALGPVVRETRAEPDPGWARELDARVAGGFRAPEPPRRASGRRWWTGLLGPGATVAVAALLVGLVVVLPGGSRDLSESAGGGMTTLNREGDRALEVPEGGATAEEAASSAAEPLPPSPVPPGGRAGSPGTDARAKRKVERSASITLATRPRSIDAVSARVQEVADAQGGFVLRSSVQSSGTGGGGDFALRVPTRNLDATMAALSRLAAVRDRAQTARDITAQSDSARDRLADARAERTSLLAQLEDADTLAETEELRARLRAVSREIAAAETAVRRVDNRAAFSTVAVTLVADADAGPAGEEDDGTWSPGDAAGDAVRVLEVIAGVALLALAVLAPLAMLALLAWVAARWGARRRRERALDAV